MKPLNVYSSIAAGVQIYMSGEVEKSFSLPTDLFNGSSEYFILTVRGDSILLMPENEKYEPIHIRSEQANIMGIAVGIIKRMAS